MILELCFGLQVKWQSALSSSDYTRIFSCCFRSELSLLSSYSTVETKLRFSRIQKVEGRDFGLILGEGNQTYGTRAHRDS